MAACTELLMVGGNKLSLNTTTNNKKTLTNETTCRHNPLQTKLLAGKTICRQNPKQTKPLAEKKDEINKDIVKV